MKATAPYSHTRRLRALFAVLLMVLTLCAPAVRATDVVGDRLLTLRGTVRDSQTRRTLPYATVAVADGEVGTVSNAAGEFIIKIKEAELGDGLVRVSHLGYCTATIDVREAVRAERVLTVWLTPTTVMLPEVTVSGRDPRELVVEAMARVADNYADGRQLLTGFYRETARKRRHFITIAEAVVEVSKTAYGRGMDVSTDRVRVVRGRKLLSQKSGDTLAVKLMGGPTMGVYLDIVKNPNDLLSPEMIDMYFYRMESVTDIDGRHHYVVAFYPQYVAEWALFYGRYYIDMETLTLSRAEFMLDLSDRQKATRSILHKKPATLRFRPIEVAYTVDYKQGADGRSRLNYMRSQIDFRCDWRRRLFATEYSVVSEMVVTDSRPSVGQEITRQQQFLPGHIFSDEAVYFSDPDYWGAYNIIAPEESLEHAVRKLLNKEQRTKNK